MCRFCPVLIPSHVFWRSRPVSSDRIDLSSLRFLADATRTSGFEKQPYRMSKKFIAVVCLESVYLSGKGAIYDNSLLLADYMILSLTGFPASIQQSVLGCSNESCQSCKQRYFIRLHCTQSTTTDLGFLPYLPYHEEMQL